MLRGIKAFTLVSINQLILVSHFVHGFYCLGYHWNIEVTKLRFNFSKKFDFD